MLVPVTQSVSLIAKAAAEDPDGAAELARISMYETFYELVDQYGPSVSDEIEKSFTLRVDDARTELVRSFMKRRAAGEPVEDVLSTARRMRMLDDVVSKAKRKKHSGLERAGFTPDNPDTPYFDARDEGGRFAAQLSGKDPGARHEDLQRRAKKLKRSGAVDEGADVLVHGRSSDFFEERDTGRKDNRGNPVLEERRFQKPLRAKITSDGLNFVDETPPDFDPTRVQIDGRNVRSASESTVADLGRQFIGFEGGQANRGKFGDNLRNVADPSQGNGDRRGYRQLAAAGGAVRQLSAPGSPTHTVGTVAQVAGQLGPEAERVLGPGIRRTAYRYRGTEKTPSPELVREVSAVSGAAGALGEGVQVQPDGSLSAGAASYYSRSSPNSRFRGQSGQSRAQVLEPDQLALALRGDVATGYLLNKIPNPDRAALSIEAGRVPPSQGVIVDADGDVVAEAVGAGTDHYLPFDLKNLKRLQGGQYARTRVAGGPTTEDLYTGLLTGTRQLQVASNSGVFTVEFDPSLRGSRRYSDKARAMVGRYQALLDRIHQSQTGQAAIYGRDNDLSASAKAEIRQGALERAGGDPAQAKVYYEADLKNARALAAFTEPTEDELYEAATSQVLTAFRQKNIQPGRSQLANAIEDRARELAQSSRGDRVKALQLDGEGYFRALQSLQEEFPYFIRDVNYEQLRDFAEDRGRGGPDVRPRPGRPNAPDSGYVQRGNVTAHDRQQSSSSAPRETSDDGGGAVQSSGAGPKSPPPSPASAKALRPYTPTSGAVSTPAELGVDLSSAFGSAATAIDVSDSIHPDDISTDEASVARALSGGTPVYWLKAYVGANGGWGGAAKKLATSGTPAELDKAIEAIDKATEHGRSEARQADLGDDSSFSPGELAGLKQAKVTLLKIKAARGGLREVDGDPALADPADGGAVKTGTVIDRLGDNPANYDEFEQKQRLAGGTYFSEALDKLKGMDTKQRDRHVSEAVREYQRTVAYGSRPTYEPNHNVKASWQEAKDVVAQKEKHPQYQRLLAMQQAHSFLTQREALGGGAAPKAPPAQGVTTPLFSSREEEKVRVGKSRRRVVVYPPDSAVAKAWAQSRRRVSSVPAGRVPRR